jgi:hypothetical protein
LGLDDLLIAIGANFDHALIVRIARMSDSQNVLARWQRFQNNAA